MSSNERDSYTTHTLCKTQEPSWKRGRKSLSTKGCRRLGGKCLLDTIGPMSPQQLWLFKTNTRSIESSLNWEKMFMTPLLAEEAIKNWCLSGEKNSVLFMGVFLKRLKIFHWMAASLYNYGQCRLETLLYS